MSAKKLFQALLDHGIVGSRGKTTFSLGGITTPAKDISVIGNLIQDWLAQFMNQKKIEYRLPTNSQEFPDFYLSQSDTSDLLEVKCFTKSPNFDIANFNAYCRSLRTAAHRLDADYLIFKYKAHADHVEIEEVWLKKVWQIASGSERSDLKIQWKQNQAVNIRPGTWYSDNTQYPCFDSRLDFVKAIEKVQNTQSNRVPRWLDEVATNYQKTTGRKL
ncbi:MAG: NgoBV family restriction endonuclease [Brachymonas sp.]|nr:NgoBV family restriction endonuclease [Brachymonas sp.]